MSHESEIREKPKRLREEVAWQCPRLFGRQGPGSPALVLALNIQCSCSMASSTILAHSHCDDCFRGVKHSGTAAGQTVTIADVPTYVSNQPSATAGSPKKVILFFADIYGPFSLNNELVQDYFASQGFCVLGIDYFLGDPVSLHTEAGFDRLAWVGAKRKTADEITPKWLAEVRKMHGPESKYCAVGYCFGAPYVMELGATDDIVAAAFAHPAFLDEDHFRKLKQPLLLSCAETDFTFALESRRRAEDILVEVKAQYQFQVFSGVQHGFALRGDPSVPDARWAKEESASGIVRWFSRFCA
ncbi:Alpha/Beta hydrolase protein [Mycena belliarum]|uniref:Alpha/Beta hydrolase protein n=1 Tax=Mycena belliarum TaxID=1033014 RepID=A0AAD6TYH9_9AGAR|nr:Alpha/Beta hydrolase protein [Mycena belliae]